ncbi:MAG: hypothetical protein QNJ11_14840 [Woeseiaceae bacterium]|nr:hypothetical protein [Woeseiaceae bacterium]
MTRVIRNSLKSWMFVYIGLVAAIVLAGQPDEVEQQDTAVPLPAIVGSAPLLRRDI